MILFVLKERQKLKELDEQRQKAEQAIAEAHAKLEAAEEVRRKAAEAIESAKSRTRNMNIPQGLAKPLQVSTSFILEMCWVHIEGAEGV